VISIALVPKMNLLEGGILFVFFLVSCLMIDSVFNPRKIKSPKIAQALRFIGYKNCFILVLFHISITLILAAHLSYILLKSQILLIVVIGLGLNFLNSRYLSRIRSFNQLPNVTGILSGVMLPMFGAFYIVGNSFDIFSLSIIIGIGFSYVGIEIFNQTRKDLEITPQTNTPNSIEWEAISVASELNLPESRAKEIAIQLYNIRNEDSFKNLTQDDCILFLPHCLRIADRCKATYNEEGLQCKHCSKLCKINIITRAAAEKGIKFFVVPGGSMVFNIAKKYRPKGVIAVACFNELREGTSRTENEYNVPFQVIPLSKDGCVNTEVGVEDVLQIISNGFNMDENN
jgi:hypothetical protein